MAKIGETKRAFVEDGARKTYIGGQALIEGVMMRGRQTWALAVREPSGRMYFEQHSLSKNGQRPKWMGWPLVRGCVALVDSLVLGYKALEVAANHALVEEDADSSFSDTGESPVSPAASAMQAMQEAMEDAAEDAAPEAFDSEACAEVAHGFSWKNDFGRPDVIIEALGAQTKLEVVHEAAPEGEAPGESAEPADTFGKGEMVLSAALGIVLGLALFIFVPALLSNVLVGDYEQNPLAWNLVDGFARVGIFVLYVWLIGRMKDIRRMFSYHGAEHKTIHCYEHGLPLIPQNARQFPRLHVRCGTAFLIMVMIVAILVYTIVPLDAAIAALGIEGVAAFALLIVVRIALIPLIAGISYEITVRWAGTHPENPLVRVVLWPGMQMQRLTTNEPDDGMLECAIKAMQLVLASEETEAAEEG